MKILIITQYFFPEEFKINDLVENLSRDGHDMSVFTGLPNYPQGHFAKGYSLLSGPYFERGPGNCKIYRTPIIPRGKHKNIQLLLNYASYCLLGALIVPWKLRKEKFDHILVYQPSPVFIVVPGIVMKFLRKIPMSLWITDLWPNTLEAIGIIKSPKIIALVTMFVQWAYQCCDNILITSKSYGPHILKIFKPKKPLIFLPQWPEPHFLEKVEISLEIQKKFPKGFVSLFAGNVGTSQSLDTIIDAAKILLKESQDYYWVVLGDGLDLQRVKKRVKDENLDKNFLFFPPVPVLQVPLYYCLADALIVSLKDEELFGLTIPAKLQTCMASGIPILGSINGEAADIIREANCGMVSEACNVDEFANATRKLYQTPIEERRVLGGNGKRYCLENFERNKLKDKLVSVMESSS